jgi:hypothetical protein
MKSMITASVSKVAAKAADLAPRIMEERRRTLETKVASALHDRKFDLNELSAALAHSKGNIEEVVSLFRTVVESSTKLSMETKAVFRDGIAAMRQLIEKADTKEERAQICANLMDLMRMARDQDKSDKRHSRRQLQMISGVVVAVVSIGGFILTKGKIKPRIG